MDLNNMQLWHWFAIIGGIVLVLGLIMYFLPAGKVKVPAVITTAFAAMGTGLALGIIFMAAFGYQPMSPAPPTEEGSANSDGPPAKGKMIAPGMPAGPGAAKGKDGPGRGPSPRLQLASLVNALDTVVDQPVSVTLTGDERAAIAKELEGLEAGGDINDEDAKRRLAAVQKILEKNRKALETVGYRWVTEGKAPPKTPFPKDSPNPFKEGPAAERLKSLMGRLAQK